MNTAHTLLVAAAHALRSYEHGNASPDLAIEVANAIDVALSGGEAGTGSSAPEILRALVERFRWRHQGYSRLVCPSCGAIALEDEADCRQVRRVGECAPTCLWQRAEEAVKSAAPRGPQ